MKNKCLRKTLRLIESCFNRLNTSWCRLFIGEIGKGTVIRRHCRLDGDRLDKVVVGKNCAIDSYFVIGARSRMIVDGNKIEPKILIGDNCTIGQYNHITAVNRIEIGENLLTGRFVLITDNSHGGLNYEEMQNHPSKRSVVSKGPIIIGNNVWIGDKASILSGVHIGDGCVIAANSVVTHDIPAYSVAAGSPARVIKTVAQ